MTNELMEINIDSPIEIRRRHRYRREEWLIKSREQDRREVDNERYKKLRTMSKKVGLCVTPFCDNIAEKGKRSCKKCLKIRRDYDRRVNMRNARI